MRFFLLLLFILLFTQNLFAKRIVLSTHKAHLIHSSPTDEVHVESGAIIKVREKPNGLLLVAKKKGHSQVIVGKRKYKVYVLSKKAYSVYEILLRSINYSPQVKFHFLDDKIHLSGKISSWALWQKLHKAALKHKKIIHLDINLSPSIHAEIIKSINALVSKLNLPQVKVVFKPKALILAPNTKNLLDIYKTLFKPLGFQVILDQHSVPTSPNIEISVIIAEVKKGFLLRYGLKWPSSIQASFIPEKQLIDGPQSLFQLDAIENSGEAEVLASPRLLSSSSEKATFVSGGELPFRSGRRGGEIFWKKHGIVLDFLPRIDSKGTLHLKINAEISSPDFSQAIDGLPGFTTSRISTDIKQSSAKTILISGLFREEKSRNRQGLPFLSRIPILGPLFSSRDFQDKKSELIILVTPRVIPQEQLQNASDKDIKLKGLSS